MQVIAASTGLRREPDPEAPLETELLCGERFVASGHATRNNVTWYHGKSELDGYEGWVSGLDVHRSLRDATHRVAAVRAIVYREPNFMAPPSMRLSMNARVTVVGEEKSEEGAFAKLSSGAYVFADQLSPLDTVANDHVAEGLKLLGTPYLWGGRDTNNGVDCSALTQHAFLARGIVIPRDSGPQWESEATGVRCDELSPERGQTIYWKGHVGILVSPSEVLHASVYRREVVVEPLEKAIADRREPLGRKRLA